MASIALFVAMLLLGSSSSSSSLADVTTFLTCSGSDDTVTSSEERIKNFLDCLREQGHNEELLAELRRSFEGQTPSAANVFPPGGGGGGGALSFCSGMTDLQCRTLTVVLESLLNASPSPPGDQSPLSLNRRRRRRVTRSQPKEEQPSSVEETATDGQGGGGGGGGGGQRSRGSSHETEEDPEEDPEEEEEEETAKKRRMRRVVAPLAGLSFKLPDKLTPEMQAVLESYLIWRGNNGYGKITGRWG